MTDYFLNSLSDDFKTKLLNDTKKEVQELFKDKTLSDIDKNNILMLFVQPLYYSKLESFFNVWLLENEISIEDVLKSTYINEDDKKLFFSTLCSKIGIQSTNIKSDSALIMNKLFLDKGNILADFNQIISEVGTEIWATNAATNYPKFNNSIAKFLSSAFYAPVAIENLSSKYNAPWVFDTPILKSELSEYTSLDSGNKSYLNNGIIALNPKNVKSSSTSINISKGDSKIIAINGYIWGIDMDVDNDSNIEIMLANNFGFSNNSINVKLTGPVKGKINWEYFEVSEELTNKIKSNLKGIDIELTCPFRIECSISLLDNTYLEQYKNAFSFYSNYNSFFNAFKDLVTNSKNLKSIPNKYSAKIFINPIFYKDTSFNAAGIDFTNSILINNIPKEMFAVRISDIYVEDTNEHYSL